MTETNLKKQAQFDNNILKYSKHHHYELYLKKLKVLELLSDDSLSHAFHFLSNCLKMSRKSFKFNLKLERAIKIAVSAEVREFEFMPC